MLVKGSRLHLTKLTFFITRYNFPAEYLQFRERTGGHVVCCRRYSAGGHIGRIRPALKILLVVVHASWSMLHKRHDHIACLVELLLSLRRGGEGDGIRHFLIFGSS